MAFETDKATSVCIGVKWTSEPPSEMSSERRDVPVYNRSLADNCWSLLFKWSGLVELCLCRSHSCCGRPSLHLCW